MPGCSPLAAPCRGVAALAASSRGSGPIGAERQVPDSLPHLPFLELLRFWGGGVCHQLPERSLQIAGVALPLCARCTGTYLGATIGLLAVVLGGRTRASRFPPWPALVAFGVFFLVWAGDGVNSYLTLFPGLPHLYEPRNALRLLTGTFEGLALSLILWPVAAATFWRYPQDKRVISLRGLAVALAAAGVAVVAILRRSQALLYGVALLTTLSLLGLFALLNGLVLTVALHREGTVQTGREAVRLFAVALLLAMAELAALSLLRHWLLGP